MKLGARILKTGIAIALAIYLAKLLGLQSLAFAGIGAVFAIQPSIYRTYQSIIEQIQANIIGALIAIVFVLTFGNDPLVVGLAAIILISINLKLKIETTIPIALVTVIAIMINPGENFIEFAFLRFSAIMIGVFSSFLVNLLFIPPKYETKLYYKVVDYTESIIQWIRISSRNVSEHIVVKDELDRLKEKMIKLENTYLLYKEERNYFRTNKSVKGRKLVLFRQMIVTTNSANEILKKMHRLENEFNHLPTEFLLNIKNALDSTVGYHEQLLMRYAEKIKTKTMMYEGIESEKEQLTISFLKHINKENPDDKCITVLPLFSLILDYYDQLIHLEKLIDSFQTYHKESNEVKINEKDEY